MKFNGTIQLKVKRGGGRDNNGNPIPVSYDWSDPTGCLFKRIKHNQIYQEGKFDISSYEILIEMQDFQTDRVRLIDNRNNVLGEFEVQDIVFADSSGRVKITL